MFFSKTPAAVLWDLDGTLIDSEHYWMKSEADIARRFNTSWTTQDGLDLVGMSLFDSSRIIKEKTGADMDAQEIIDELTEAVSLQLRQEIPWRPGARETLLMLKNNGIKTALVTMSMSRMALQVVEAIGFEAFDAVVAGDDVVNGKPHPEPYLTAAALLGVDPWDCVAFEDSLAGIRSAEAAGTKAVGISHVVPIPQEPGRILWPTLEGVQMSDLRKLFG
jgi:HAD superfamily hydrolase (TIGR01509 family)